MPTRLEKQILSGTWAIHGSSKYAWPTLLQEAAEADEAMAVIDVGTRWIKLAIDHPCKWDKSTGGSGPTAVEQKGSISSPSTAKGLLQRLLQLRPGRRR